MDKETTNVLANFIEIVAGIEKDVGDLSAVLIALRLTLAEMGNFERRYAKHYEGPEVQQVIRAAESAHDGLLKIAQTLRGQS